MGNQKDEVHQLPSPQFKLTEVAGAVAPEYLQPEQNLLDQPPFSFLLADMRIFDPAIISGEGELEFLRAVVREPVDNWGELMHDTWQGRVTPDSQKLELAVWSIDKEYRDRDTVLYMARQVEKFLKQYPF